MAKCVSMLSGVSESVCWFLLVSVGVFYCLLMPHVPLRIEGGYIGLTRGLFRDVSGCYRYSGVLMWVPDGSGLVGWNHSGVIVTGLWHIDTEFRSTF